MTVNYHAMFNKLFEHGYMASTYKPVFLRSLLDIGDLADERYIVGQRWLELSNERLYVDLNFIAIRFAKYYWDMEYGFHLRQSQDPHDARIVRIIKAYHDPRKDPPTIQDLAEDTMHDFRRLVITKSLKPEVMVHIKTDMKNLFEKHNSNTICFDESFVNFLNKHKTILKQGLNNKIATYLERLNQLTPQIATKVDIPNKPPEILNKSTQNKFERAQDSKCFYCLNKFHKSFVDHVIPYNYVFSTKPYNCVLVCKQCNNQKTNMLPNRSLFDNVLYRNKEIIGCMDDLKHQYDEAKYRLLFESCMNEYNRHMLFEPKSQ